ncbi:hypothetical protein K438DRAFT_1562073 [Mycena galopus ATCC 62051]|nr:hypothetical protein K438DRAFT_1562073 [Mycena galopus ATCC 62051]
MTTNSAIVDDRDPLIKYTGTWGQAGSSEEYSETTTFSVVPGSTATFPFTGSSVTVYGTIAANNFSTQATWSFAVDSSVTGTYTPPANMTSDIHHQALWTTPASSIANGTHSLLITQTASSSTQVLYLDYIIFTTTSLDVGSYFIDDRDPRVVYSPPWQLFGSEGDFMHTSQETSGAGDYLTLEFEGACADIFAAHSHATIQQAARSNSTGV